MIRFKVNGKERTYDGDPEMPLLWYLRDIAGFTGTKFGCGMALCGACTVHRNGEAVRSCSVAMRDVSGTSITTIEGISATGLHPVQKAWMEIKVPQCGYCQTGQIMQAIAFLGQNRNPSDAEIDEGVVRAAKNADVLVMDAQYTPEEYEIKAGWGHSSIVHATGAAQAANVEKLLLFHHDPMHNDAFLDQMLERAQGLYANTDMAREGEVLPIGKPESGAGEKLRAGRMVGVTQPIGPGDETLY